MFFDGFVLKMQENGQNLEAEIQQVAVSFDRNIKVVENMVLKFFFFFSTFFRRMKSNYSNRLKKEQNTLEIIFLCLQKHLRNESIKVLVVFNGSLAQSPCKGIKHFSQVFIKFGFRLIVFVYGLKYIFGNPMGILGVKIRFEVPEMDKITVADSDERIDCHEKHCFDGF